VLAPAGVGKLPLATVLPRLSLTAHASVSALEGLAAIASGNVLPEANIRVPSALGVSTVMTPLADELVAVSGEAHAMRNAGVATVEGETTATGLAAAVEPVVPVVVLAVVPDVVVAPDPLVEPVAAEPDAVLDALAVVPAPPPLVAAVEPELAGSPDPPPPQAANASTTE
jgi:hypothetical protein